MDDFARLYEVKCDDKFFAQLGFHRTKTFLERLLSERLTASIAPTLQVLEEACRKSEAELASVRKVSEWCQCASTWPNCVSRSSSLMISRASRFEWASTCRPSRSSRSVSSAGR